MDRVPVDQLRLKNMRFYARHGVFSEENALGQQFIADITLTLDLSSACRSDDLIQTIDYSALYEAIRQTIEERTFRLIETVAEEVAYTILNFDTRIESLQIELTKPNPPFKVFFDGVSVTVNRSRADLPRWSWIGLGSNIGDRTNWLRTAFLKLDEDPHTKVMMASDVYETAPVGPVDQGAYLNQVALLRTNRTAHELLELLQQIEQQCGRERSVHWGPRTLDLDLLLYEKEQFSDANLNVPHPFMAERAFVLVPFHQALQEVINQSKPQLFLRPVTDASWLTLQADCKEWLSAYACSNILVRDGKQVVHFAKAESVWERHKGV